MNARLYSNEDSPLPVVEALRRNGCFLLTPVEAGRANQAIPDEAVLEFAPVESQAVLTPNRQEFISLHRRHSEYAGIIVCMFSPDFAALAEKIHATLDSAGRLTGTSCGSG